MNPCSGITDLVQRRTIVSVGGGCLVDFDPDQATSALRCYERIGRVTVFVGLVTDDPEPVILIRSPRLENCRVVRDGPHQLMKITRSSDRSKTTVAAL